jgi:dTDP-4-dehydrorhamnose 3,5-epimerase
MDKMINGVILKPLKRIVVPKGDIFHALKCTDEGYTGFGEAYFSQIKENQIKGWKRHNRMTLNLIVIIGEVKFVIYDDRKESISYGRFEEIIISPESNYQRLTIVPGLWVAFAGIGKGLSMLMDIIPELHDPTEIDRKELDDIKYNFNI